MLSEPAQASDDNQEAMMDNVFPYGEEEIAYLKKKDKKLAAIIDELGHPNRPMRGDLFTSVVDSIVGQQISTKAHATVWARLVVLLGGEPSSDGTTGWPEGVVTPDSICAKTIDELQSCGMTFTKASYIREFAEKVQSGAFDLEAVKEMSDEDAIAALSSLRGIGVWTAEMILLHCLARPDILSFGDLAILRGMRMVYRHRTITREQFERYRRRYSPYGSVASIYLWKVSAFTIPGLTDPAPKKKAKAKAGSKTARKPKTED